MKLLGRELPSPETEYHFAKHILTKKGKPWGVRFDFAWPDQKVAVEIEGGQYIQGRHQRPQGFEDDCRKYNQAAADGWRVLRFTSNMLDTEPVQCIDHLKNLL